MSAGSLNKDSIDKIEDIVEQKKLTVEVDGITYATRNLTPIIHDPHPDNMSITTLTGLVDYLKTNVDELNKEDLIVRVNSHSSVQIISKFAGMNCSRAHFLSAGLDRGYCDFSFDQYQNHEDFIVNCLSKFEQTDDMKLILQYVGNLQAGAVTERVDDGVTQNATMKTTNGSRMANVDMKSRVTLTPFRTFREIEQPSSEFVFRLQNRENSEGAMVPTCALFESDGSKWKLDAIESIRDYLRGEFEKNRINVAIIA